jgi:hypothetical protein
MTYTKTSKEIMYGDMTFRVACDDKFHHVVCEVSMTSVVFPEFTLVCVKEECKE